MACDARDASAFETLRQRKHRPDKPFAVMLPYTPLHHLLMKEKWGLKILPGMEVQSREEIHILTLFPDWPSLNAWAHEVRQHLPLIPKDPPGSWNPCRNEQVTP